jgi:hypothetical protein
MSNIVVEGFTLTTSYAAVGLALGLFISPVLARGGGAGRQILSGLGAGVGGGVGFTKSSMAMEKAWSV